MLWLNLSTSEGQLERGGRNVKAISIIKLLYMFKASCGIVVDKHIILFQEEFEDTKGVIRIRKSKMNRQLNVQQKKYKRINNDLQNIHIKLKIE